MSNRTIMEFNHDFTHEIRADPAGFAAAMLEQGRAANNPHTIERLRRYGVVIVETVHHSTDRSVRIEGKDIQL